MPEASNPDKAIAEIEAAMRAMEALAKPSSKPAGRLATPTKSRLEKPAPGEKPVSLREGAARKPMPAVETTVRPSKPIYDRIRNWIIGIVIAIVLPFYLLLRLSVFLNQSYQVWPWLAIVGGMGATVLLLMLYTAWMRWRIGSGFRFSRGVATGLIMLVAVYVGYTAMYISGANVKTEEVRATYTSLHPLMRLGLSTFMMADQEVVMTDAERQLEDYAGMGLPVNEGSLHFVQGTGYVHAMDLRTKGRAEWKTFLMTAYFKAMGFRTLRHTGTADHLHVSLPAG